MKKKITTVFLAIALCVAATFGFTACDNGTDGPAPLPPLDNSKTDYGMWKLDTAEQGVGEFVTDFYERHIRNADDKQIHNLNLGLANMFLKDWEALSLMWADSTTAALKYDGYANIRNYANGIPIDKYGYVWQSYQTTLGTLATAQDTPWGPNWAFPTYAQSGSNSVGFEFNANEDTEYWTTNASNEITATGGLLKVTNKGGINENLEIISPSGLGLSSLHSPYAHVDFRISAKSKKSEIEDIELWYTTDESPEWDANNMLSLLYDTSFERYELPRFMAEAIYFPCYLKESWENIKQVKFVVVPKEGEKITSDIALNYVRFDYDARQANDNGIYLNTLKTYVEFTGDTAVLEKNLARARNSLLFLTKTLGGEENKLIDQSYMQGHDGVRGNGRGIGNGYWDIISTPGVSFYANVFYVKALRAMIWLEEAAAKLGIDTEEAYIYAGDLSGEIIAWDYSIEKLESMLNETVEQMRKPYKEAIRQDDEYFFNYEGGFWNEADGRFLEGVNSVGEVIDYGFVSFNLEAIYEDIPTAEQSLSIMDWISGKRIVEGDTAKGYRGNYYDKDGYVNENVELEDVTYGIYDFEFAPRSTTKNNSKHYVFAYSGVDFGKQVQNGGAIMYVSFYDIMARLKVYGADNAYTRLKEIQAWYNRVQEAAEAAEITDSWKFYRAYYIDRGITMQGGGTAGGIGLDYEFLEAALFYACVPYGFFGISGTCDTLTVAPVMSAAMGEWRMQNMMFASVKYDVTATANSVRISAVRGVTTDKFITVELNAPASGQAVYNNYRKLEASEYVVSNGKVLVTVPMAACLISVE